jgi:hypothetical protein
MGERQNGRTSKCSSWLKGGAAQIVLLGADAFEANRTLSGATTRKRSQTEEMMCFQCSMTVAGR